MNVASPTPLFPLQTVLFPGMLLPLRIFEARYVDMIGTVLREGSAFGVVPIRQGSEVGATPQFFPFGTLASIESWDRGDDGLLHVRIQGEQRFVVGHNEVRPNRLLVGEVSVLEPPEDASIPADLSYLSDVLKEIFERHMRDAPYVDWQLDSALWVAYRLAEIMPINTADKLAVLQADSGLAALARLHERMGRFAQNAPRGTRH